MLTVSISNNQGGMYVAQEILWEVQGEKEALKRVKAKNLLPALIPRNNSETRGARLAVIEHSAHEEQELFVG